jgi:hypothetical protein
LRDALAVSRIYPFLQDMPGNRSINRTRIDVGEAESPGKLARYAAFSRGGRAVNGNNAMKTFPHVGRN